LSLRGKLDTAKETARIIRLMAEDQSIQPAPSNNPWVIIGYVFGGIFALQVLFVLIAIIASAFGGI